MALVRVNEKKCDADFLFSYFLSPIWRREVEKHIITGATVDRIPLTDVPVFELTIPPLPTQRKIAGVLSAYDDLIENNLRRIGLLEEMAQITYEEWFVRLRFPSHETVPENPETGLPEGWEFLNLDEIISVKHGYAFKGEFFKEEESSLVLLTPGNFKIGGGIKLDKIKYYSELGPINDEYVLENFDLLVTMTDLSKDGDTLGYPLLVPTSANKKFLHNQRLGKITPKRKSFFPRFFLYQLFKDERYRGFVLGSASGATVRHTSPARILSFKVALPNSGSDILKKFDSAVEPIFKEIDNLYQQNRLLREGRDLLLPRLVAGIVDIDNYLARQMPLAGAA